MATPAILAPPERQNHNAWAFFPSAAGVAPPASTSLATVGDASSVCPSAHGTIIKVRGFPSSPFKWTPFTQTYANPPRAQIAASYVK